MGTQENERKVTSVREWKSKKGAELTLPSGNVALVRNPGMQHFLRVGIIPDPLTGMITKMISGKKDVDPSDLIKSVDDINDAFSMFDRVLCEVVIEPSVEMPPEHDSDRDDEVLYADDVDFDDKVFIFQFAVGGTKDLEVYLQRQAEAMDAVQSGKGLELSPKPSP